MGRRRGAFDDMIEAMILMMKSDLRVTGPINVGNPDEYSMIELAETVISIVGGSSKIIHLPLPADDPKQRRPDISVASEILGWRPSVPLREGIVETVEYFRRELAK
jgi:UDP-glucuronate decarboxylase